MAHGLSIELAEIKAPVWRPAVTPKRKKTPWQELTKKTRNKIRRHWINDRKRRDLRYKTRRRTQ